MLPNPYTPGWVQFYDPFKTCLACLPVDSITEIVDYTHETDSSPTTLITTRDGNSYRMPNSYFEVMRQIRPALGLLATIPEAGHKPAALTDAWNDGATSEAVWDGLADHLDAQNVKQETNA